MQRTLFLRAPHGLKNERYQCVCVSHSVASYSVCKAKLSLLLKPVLPFSKELKFLWSHGLVKVLSKTLNFGVNNQEPE